MRFHTMFPLVLIEDLAPADSLNDFDTIPGMQCRSDMRTAWHHFHIHCDSRTFTIGYAQRLQKMAHCARFRNGL